MVHARHEAPDACRFLESGILASCFGGICGLHTGGPSFIMDGADEMKARAARLMSLTLSIIIALIPEYLGSLSLQTAGQGGTGQSLTHSSFDLFRIPLIFFRL